ncbi:MAG TPA: transcriptional regulator [Phycisphaerae bacterium]|jgi:predicted DNA-binding transcriptional regulator YafY|nr:transcriptional regulator [Phycisphaerae bacterium]HOB75493.1 transcriptional regulator [Phycisphaerae bacterium]HOJ55283.1 transcriptional regulator [Phycisphaerae bacterium]HOL27429.1 transcriptional regulator [Phycisphaerae bacterium]HPP21586.1 transcriptional regulator [Phycisphaerae bacterium]
MGRGDSLLRQWQLLNFLQKNRRGITLRDLADLSGYSARTIQRDLKLLSDAGFPVSHETNDYGKRFWRLPPDFLHREGLVLSITEAVALYFARQLLSPLQGTEFAHGLDSVISKIRAMLPETALDYFQELSGLILVRGQGRADYARHKHTIQAFSQAIRTRSVVRITYKAVWRGETYTTEVHPYGLVYFEGDLYVVGHSERSRAMRVFKITRTLHVEVTRTRFQRPTTFSLEEYFHGSFGIMPSGAHETQVVVEFHPQIAPLIEERQWHPSQRFERTDSGWVRISLRLRNTLEFKRWVLGFGHQARVIHPPALRKEIAEALSAALALYREPSLCTPPARRKPAINALHAGPIRPAKQPVQGINSFS